MKFDILLNKKNNDIIYTLLPISLYNSWNILTSISPHIYYYFCVRDGWKYGEIIPVIIEYDKHYGNTLYYNNFFKITKLIIKDNIVLFDNFHECLIYGISYWLNYISNLLNNSEKFNNINNLYNIKKYNNITYNINYNKYKILYTHFYTEYMMFINLKNLQINDSDLKSKTLIHFNFYY